MRKTLNYGMVGGCLTAFIGGVHRMGISFDGRAKLVAGCFSNIEQENQETADFYGLDQDRVYATFEEMAEKESQREDGIDFVTIATPNFLHYQTAKTFLEHGIHVLCEKPLCFTLEEAEELKAIADKNKLFFCVNYSYSGNNLVKEARELIMGGTIGEVINVNAEYLQEYLVDDIGDSGEKMVKLSSWRKDPKLAGISNCVGDIGTHIEHTVAYMTGLKLKKVAAKLDTYGQPLDLNANILVEFDNGCHGVFCSSQVCVGHMNGLAARIFGTEGAIEWVQENPNVLYVTLKGQPTQVYNRGMGYLTDTAKSYNRLPSGHPEGLYEAFGNIYKAWISTLLDVVNGQEPAKEHLDFPTVDAGIEGVRFIHACVASNNNGSAWTEL